MRIAVKDRLLLGALLIAIVLVVVGSVPWSHHALEQLLDLHPGAHITLEASLNVLWLLLAVGAFSAWTARNERRRRYAHGFVHLIFVFCLLFPVISADDDLAQLDLINDVHLSRSIVADLDHHKHPPSSALQHACPVAPHHGDVSPLLAFGFAPATAPAAAVAAPGGATGNHSPPIALT